ncbi:hypothetical protein [Sorangium sp. So ce124]|uniref:hypothetical protein n=1 Tax=Sorangium sp. So ce124 TaxID=3133280 RepID=UPI003F60027D
MNVHNQPEPHLFASPWMGRHARRGVRHPIALGADSVRSAVSDAITDELLMGCRYAVFDHATQALGEPTTVQGFDAPRKS